MSFPQLILDELAKWQDLTAGILSFFAGILGFFAAIYAVRKTLQSEQRKEERELVALSRALTAEIFQFASHSLKSHLDYKSASMRPDGFTVHEMEEATRFVMPVIYPSTASRIGVLGDHAHEVVLFYARIQTLIDTVIRIRRDSIEGYAITREMEEAMFRNSRIAGLGNKPSTEVFIGKANSKDVLQELLIIAETGEALLPHLTKGTIDEAPVSKFHCATVEARAKWGVTRISESD